MSFKKYDGSTWQSITPKKLKGIPYTGTLPATLTGTKAGYLQRYKIYGNTEQTGTPTPENPIVPSECGERTDNVFDYNASVFGKYIDSSGVEKTSEAGTTSHSDMIKIKPNTTYSVVYNKPNYYSVIGAIAWYDSNGDFLLRNSQNLPYEAGQYVITFPSPPTAEYAIFNFGCYTNKNYEKSNMFIAGSTAPTLYIPYGYKLPLASAGQSVDIYLGESQTTRRIKKLVLTGEEGWQSLWGVLSLSKQISAVTTPRIQTLICDRYDAKYNLTTGQGYPAQYGNNSIAFRNYASSILIRDDTFGTDTTSFKSYLAAQYANGTPVTVWYVLAEPETGILNEPLRKIGDYADTIDSTQTNAQIPTSAGSTTISWAGEGLAPSEFDSIQEWVDIPTYTRVNGAWVEDN